MTSSVNISTMGWLWPNDQASLKQKYAYLVDYLSHCVGVPDQTLRALLLDPMVKDLTTVSQDLPYTQSWIHRMHRDVSQKTLNYFLIESKQELEMCETTKRQVDSDIEPQPCPLVVILENIRSAFNVGSILRTLDHLGGSRAYLCGYTADLEEHKIKKTSKGVENYLNINRCHHTQDAIKQLRAQGYTIAALETSSQAQPLSLSCFTQEKTALLLGNERRGITQESLAETDSSIVIPRYGHKNSLNVGVAFGIGAYFYKNKFGSIDDNC